MVSPLLNSEPDFFWKCQTIHHHNPEKKEENCTKCGAFLSMDSLQYERGTKIAGKYEIVREMGRDLDGVVYWARHLLLEQDLLLKFIHPSLFLDLKEVERFRKEVVKTASIDHSNLLRTFDLDDTGDHPPFLVSDFPKGSEIDVFIRQGNLFSLARVIEIISQVLSGLQALHQKSMIHRTLSPHSIYLAERDEKDYVQLANFGPVRVLREWKKIGTSELAGIPPYTSPEQIRGKREKLDVCSDIWSVGVILYQLLTGHLPFQGGTPTQTVLSVLQDNVVPPIEKAPLRGIPAEVNAICIKALSKDREKRPQSASALLSILQRVQIKSMGEATVELKRNASISLLELPTSKSQHSARVKLNRSLRLLQKLTVPLIILLLSILLFLFGGVSVLTYSAFIPNLPAPTSSSAKEVSLSNSLYSQP